MGCGGIKGGGKNLSASSLRGGQNLSASTLRGGAKFECNLFKKDPSSTPFHKNFAAVPKRDTLIQVLLQLGITSGFPDCGFPAYFCHSKHVF